MCNKSYRIYVDQSIKNVLKHKTTALSVTCLDNILLVLMIGRNGCNSFHI